ncbi:MAG TPA: D-glycero-beta-D-manno-heptose 1-phosphate adenylyltransferase [Candidatus Ratteibacteria bacterium]|mgnify:CR=1 FL=1|nr:D-glycero-beta-D-manno-heptose 1-phosphate adenylyltransferase [Candidatus Ratteibacteria bacterium]
MRKKKSFKEIVKIVKELKRENKKIVFTNGCFDIIHSGHIKLLKKAKQLGDVVIVGINKDSSIKKIKGKNRPILNENQRIEIISAIEFVDYVVPFGQTTPEKLIKIIKPDILIKGGDYKKEDVVGKDIVEKYGGKVYIFPLIGNISTTNIIKKIKNGQKS